MALVPVGGATQGAWAQRKHTVGAEQAENRQYQHVLAVAASQERRLVGYTALRRRPGYDLSDPWLVDESEPIGEDAHQLQRRKRPRLATTLCAGMPCLLTACDRASDAGEVVAYLRTQTDAGNDCLVRFGDGRVEPRPAQCLLPLPTCPPYQGDWAMVVDLPPNDDRAERLNGCRGMCGVSASVTNEDGVSQHAFWVMFEPPLATGSSASSTMPADNVAAKPDVVLLEAKHLVALPDLSNGAPRTPWEARREAATAAAALTDGSESDLRVATAAPTGSASTSVPPVVNPAEGSQQLAIPAQLVDEAASEHQLALRYGNEDEDDDAASSAAPSDAGLDSDDNGDDLVLGSLVKISNSDSNSVQYGYIERFAADATATVRLIHGLQNSYTQAAITSLSVASKEDLEEEATCSTCGNSAPEEELLLCEDFATECLGCAHIGCLKPPLKKVPDGAWYCSQCSQGRRKPRQPRAAPAAIEDDATRRVAAAVTDSPAEPQKAAVAKQSHQRPKAKAKAATSAPKAKGKAAPPRKKNG